MGTRHKSSSSTLAESRANPGVRAKVFSGRKELVCATTREENKHPPEGSVGVRAERDLDLLVPEALTMLQLPL